MHANYVVSRDQQYQDLDISSKPFLCDDSCIASLFDDLKAYHVFPKFGVKNTCFPVDVPLRF